MSKPIVAIVYDFDNTLSTQDMQEYSLIPSLKMSASDFWRQSDELANSNNMDYILSTMLLMLQRAKQDGVDISRTALAEHGKNIKFHKGVEQWFDRINSYGDALGLEVRHYIVSCGLRPMIEGCAISDKFHNIFACDFVYENGVPVWPAMAINYTSKLQFLFRIRKGVEDISEHTKLNMRLHGEAHRVPFSHMVYVGDGLTDVPSMKITRLNGGYAIGVYEEEDSGRYLVNDDRVDFYVKADYSENSEMDTVMKAILDKICATDHIERLSNLKYGKAPKTK